jgi:hypothetical protein
MFVLQNVEKRLEWPIAHHCGSTSSKRDVSRDENEQQVAVGEF